MILEILGWVLLGGVLVGCMVHFWDDVKNWLNTVAADAVERHLGYNARNTMHRAVAVVDRLMSRLKNTTTIYNKRNTSDLYYDKTIIVAESSVTEITAEQLAEFDKNSNRQVQEFVYKH